VGLTSPPWKRLFSRNLKKQQLDTLAAEASEEGQGPRRAVQPVMMLMKYIINMKEEALKTLALKSF
jgi:hypothetical protein